MKENDGPIEHPGLLCQLCVSCFGFGDGGVFLPLQVRPGRGYDLNLDQIPNTRPRETYFFLCCCPCASFQRCCTHTMHPLVVWLLTLTMTLAFAAEIVAIVIAIATASDLQGTRPSGGGEGPGTKPSGYSTESTAEGRR